jgi:D-serine deaminase-like pyridoxal phosphate-dependent protein
MRACGIEVGAIERAFCMTEAGIDDILVAHPFYKIFGADSLIQYRNQLGFFRDGWPSYGSVQDRPDLWLGKLSAETGDLRYTYPETPPEKRPQIGERLEIIPNNATLAISTQEKIYGVRNGLVERIFAVAGRSGTSSGHAETV